MFHKIKNVYVNLKFLWTLQKSTKTCSNMKLHSYKLLQLRLLQLFNCKQQKESKKIKTLFKFMYSFNNPKQVTRDR